MSTLTLNDGIAVADVLNNLLKKHNLTSARLGSLINIPRATITNIATGKTIDPRVSTLQAIADYFNITVGQLLGREVLIDSHTESMAQQIVNVIAWEQASNWQGVLSDPEKLKSSKRISIDSISNKNIFALNVVGDAMSPQFYEGTVLIVDPDKTPNNRDFVIVSVDETKDVIFRQLFTEGKFKFLKAANQTFSSYEMQQNDEIIGVVIQARNEYV